MKRIKMEDTREIQGGVHLEEMGLDSKSRVVDYLTEEEIINVSKVSKTVEGDIVQYIKKV